MKKSFSILFVLISFSSFSQEMVKSLDLKIAKNTTVFQVVEEDKKQVSLFFNDKKIAKAIRLNNELNLIDSLSANRPQKGYEDIVGYSITKNKYYSYWSNANNKHFAAQCFDFDTKQVSLNTFDLEFIDEKPIEKITIKNVFYLITTVKSTSILNIYVFKDGKAQKKSLDLSNKTFISLESKRVTLWDLLNESYDIQPALAIQDILSETPPSLVFSANKRKAYVKDDNLLFTFDNTKSFTQMLTINLSDFTFSQKALTFPFLEETEFNIPSSNSFLLGDKMIQMMSNGNKMIIEIKDFENNEIKSLVVEKDKEIDFKNSEIIQENGKVSNTRILDKSKQLLRKIENQVPSLSCYSFNNKNYLSLGSVSPLPKNNNYAAMYFTTFGGFTGALIGMAISSNYSLDNVNSYKDRKVVYINCVFDSNFNHLNEPPKKLAFDELRAFAEKNSFLGCQSVFKFNNNLYFGGCDPHSKLYSFYTFKD